MVHEGGGDCFISKSDFGKQAHIFKMCDANFHLYETCMHFSKFKISISILKKNLVGKGILSLSQLP